MSNNERAREFLDVWEAENVDHVAQSEKSGEAEQLAPLCRADAIRAGIIERDLEEAAGGDLVAFMRDALDAADSRECPLTPRAGAIPKGPESDRAR
jgi:hypothetical protein